MERLTWLSATPNTKPSSASANSDDYHPKRSPWAINWSPPMCPRIPQPLDQELAIMFLRRTRGLPHSKTLRDLVEGAKFRRFLECGSLPRRSFRAKEGPLPLLDWCWILSPKKANSAMDLDGAYGR